MVSQNFIKAAGLRMHFPFKPWGALIVLILNCQVIKATYTFLILKLVTIPQSLCWALLCLLSECVLKGTLTLGAWVLVLKVLSKALFLVTFSSLDLGILSFLSSLHLKETLTSFTNRLYGTCFISLLCSYNFLGFLCSCLEVVPQPQDQFPSCTGEGPCYTIVNEIKDQQSSSIKAQYTAFLLELVVIYLLRNKWALK